MSYVITEWTTGASDGVFVSREIADAMLETYRENFVGEFVLLQVVDANGPHIVPMGRTIHGACEPKR